MITITEPISECEVSYNDSQYQHAYFSSLINGQWVWDGNTSLCGYNGPGPIMKRPGPLPPNPCPICLALNTNLSIWRK